MEPRHLKSVGSTSSTGAGSGITCEQPFHVCRGSLSSTWLCCRWAR